MNPHFKKYPWLHLKLPIVRVWSKLGPLTVHTLGITKNYIPIRYNICALDQENLRRIQLLDQDSRPGIKEEISPNQR